MFSNELLRWYDSNKRTLPWKETNDVYLIWLSEIILQQTRIEQGLSYFLRFKHQFPTIIHLSNAKIDDILKLWEGLGYYSRARNLHYTAQYIRDEYHGIFPKTYLEIRQLKGVGDYTAAAIASFAYNLPYAVVDGNVYRVLSRIYGIATPIDTTEGKKEFQQLANNLIDKNNASNYNQAIMDFGATVCTPKNPDCNTCPFKNNCIARKKNAINSYPVKAKRIVIKQRYFHYLVFRTRTNSILIQQRTEKDIWHLLYQFPLIETNQQDLDITLLKSYQPHKHQIITYQQKLSHQIIIGIFHEISVEHLPEISNTIKVKWKNLANYTFPKIIRNYLIDKEL